MVPVSFAADADAINTPKSSIKHDYPIAFGERPQPVALTSQNGLPNPQEAMPARPHHQANNLFPGRLRAAAFAPAPRPASLPLRSANPPHSGRPRFQLVPQPENPTAPLSRPFAPATMLGLAPLALRVWVSANGRPLHSGPFQAERQVIAAPAFRLFAPLPRFVAKTCRLWLPPQADSAAKHGKTWLPR
jgi:hypothetical protein